ncbi:MAG: glycosyltransferase family 39 protein [Desulfofustis sp.]|nr:glycosyltransferase family 39 protein [Desulfofustis sp.]
MQFLARFAYPLVIVIVFSVFYFAGLGGPVVIDYDEGVYAEVSREMYLAGEWVLPTLNGEDFFEKPPLLYWLQMAGYDMFGISAFGARFFNACCGLLTVLTLYFGARGPLGERVAFQAALVLGSSIIFVYLSRIAMTDMALTLFLTLALIVSWHGVERALREKGGAFLFSLGCLAAALAMLSKGAIGALFPVTTAVIYLVSIRRPGLLFQKTWLLPGTLILILVGFSWYLALGLVHPDGFSFMKELFVTHHFGRFSAPMEGHSGPVFYYLIVLAFGFLPWFAYLLPAISAVELGRQTPAERFLSLLAIYTGLVFLFFSVAATKLPNYIVPVLPGLAVWIAVLFNREGGAQGVVWRLAAWFAALTVGLLGLAFAALPLLFPYLHELLGKDARKTPILAEPVELGMAPWLTAVLFFACSYLIVRVRNSNERRVVFETLLLCSLIISAGLFHLVIPLYDRLMDAPLARIAQQAAGLTGTDDAIVLYAVDDRPSINFASGRTTIYRPERHFSDLPDLFQAPTTNVGITTTYYLRRLHGEAIAVEELNRDSGFVLFRIVADTTAMPPEKFPSTTPAPAH